MTKSKLMSKEKLLQEISKVFDVKFEETKRHFEVVVERLEKQISAIVEQRRTLIKNQEAIKGELEGS
ncbi:hypothetical protein KKC91_10315 [bacterium]|nr:hypothetical protein [bacterium]